MINEELPQGFPNLIEPRVSGDAETLPVDLPEKDWNRELVGTVYMPMIKELVQAIVAASAGDGATPNEFLSCHVDLFGKWSLLPPVLRTFLVTVRMGQAKSELEPTMIANLLFDDLSSEDSTLLETVERELASRFPDFLTLEPDRSRLPGIEFETAEDGLTITWTRPTELPSDFLQMQPKDFETLIARLLVSMGLDVQVTKQTGDGGVDLLARSSEPITGGLFVVQCKRYSGTVGEPVLRDLYGVMHHHRASKGILITTSNFTRQAREFAEGKPIDLVDGNSLRALLIKYRV
jgi:hypothetical protein